MDLFNNLGTTNTQDEAKKKRLQQQIEARKQQQNKNNSVQFDVDTMDSEEYKPVIDPEAYLDIQRNLIADSINPTDEEWKFQTANELAKQLDIPLADAMENLDNYIQARYRNDQKITPDNFPFPTYKNAFKAIKDSAILNINSIKQSEIGNKLRQAELKGDTEYAKALWDAYNAYESDNETRQDSMPRSWLTELAKAGASTLVYTGAVAAAGAAGNLFAPVAGTVAAFAASTTIQSGLEYMDLRNSGVSPEVSNVVSLGQGAIEGAIEAGLGMVSESLVAASNVAKAGSKTAGAMLKGASKLENATYDSLTGKLATKITGLVQKQFHFGPTRTLMVDWLTRHGFDVLGEGFEEFFQEITSKTGQNIAYALDELDVPKNEADQILADAVESFKGGILGAIALGVIPTSINVLATKENYAKMQQDATEIESEEMFKKTAADNPVVSEMDDKEKDQFLHNVFEEQQFRRNASENLKAKEFAETNATPEGYKETETTTTVNEETGEETEESVAEPVYRNENGELETSQETVLEGATTEKLYKVYDPTVEGDNLLAHVRYDIDDKNNTITIKEFNTGNNPGIAEELFDKWSRENAAGYDIKWDPIGENARNLKDNLIANNPSGANAGLNYYTSFDEVSDINARKNAIRQIDQAYKVVNRNLTKDQLQSHVTILESMFKSLKRHGDIQQNTFSDFMKFVFSDEMFGNAAEITRSDSKGASRVRSIQELEKGLRAAIYVTQKGDYSTFVHEMAHVYRNLVGNDHFNEISEAFNVQKDEDGNFKWTRDDEENFAYAFEDYLKNGKAADAKQQNIFEKIADFLRETFHALKSQIAITPEIEKVFNEMLDTDDSVIANAQRAADEYEKNENNKRIAAQQETQRKKDAEIAAQDKQTKLENIDIAVEETAANSQDFPLSANEQKEIKEEKFAAEEQNTKIEQTVALAGVDNVEDVNVLTDKIQNGSEQEKIEASLDTAESAYNENDVNDEVIFQHEYADQEQSEQALQDAKDYIDTSIRNRKGDKEAKRILDNLENLRYNKETGEETGYFLMAKESALIQRDLFDAIEGKPWSRNSWLVQENEKYRQTNYVKKGKKPRNMATYDLLDKIRKAETIEEKNNYIEYYLIQNHILGDAGKAEKAVNGSILNCNPSESCAAYCYVFDKGGHYIGINSVMKSEIVNYFVEINPEKAAEITANEYSGYKNNNYALRLFDKGDLTEQWIPFIKILNNKYNLRNHIFTKRADLADQVDPRLNNLLLSVDHTNIKLAFEHPELMLSIVYRGKQDLPLVQEYKDRVKVLLAVKGSGRKVKQDQIEATTEHIEERRICPVDAGKVSSKEYTCIQCQKAKNGCWYKDNTKAGMNDLIYENSKEVILEKAKQQGVWLNEEQQAYIRDFNLKGEQLQRFIQLWKGMGATTTEISQQSDTRGIHESLQGIRNTTATGHDGYYDQERGIEDTDNNLFHQTELEDVRKQYENTEKWLKAPNGENTQLNEKQWLQVRTPSFKKWFGDWENDPQNASKIIDKNGEPLVVYHGTSKQINEKPFTVFKSGNGENWFTDNSEYADNYHRDSEWDGWEDYTYNVFIKLKNPLNIGELNLEENYDKMISILAERTGITKDELYYNSYDVDYLWQITSDNMFADLVKSKGYDGLIATENGNNTFATFDSNQIKSATENNGNFDANNPYILYQTELEDVRKQYENTEKWLKTPNGENTQLSEKQWLQVRTPSFKKWFGDWENDPQNASKVLDENGEPLIVYHGTDKKFDIFDATKSRANMDIQGNFFSPWEIDAQGYGPNVKAFYLNIKNPATEQISYKALHTYTGQNGAGIKARELLKQQGYDGVNNSNEEYITFNANQIKSATDNNGNFDENDPSIYYQTQAELLEDAMNYESWQDFMEAYQDDFNPVALEDPEYHSQVPSDADAQWYQTTWELAHNIKPEESLREEEILEMVAADTTDAAAMDALFTSRMANNPDMLDEFLLRVADIVSVDLNSEAYAHIADAEEQAEVDKIVELQDFIGTQLAHGNWVSNAKRLKKGDDLTESTRNRILSLMRSAPRDYRAIYSEIMQDPQWAVDEKDSISNKLREKAKLTKYKAASPDTDFERLSPEKRRQIAEEMENEDIARKIKDGSLNLNDELDHYIKKLEKEIRQGKRDLEELEKETTEDYQRLADYETRKLLELNEKLQLAKLKVNKNNKEINRLIAKGQKISGKYQLDSQNLKADYNEIFRKFADLKETIVVTTKVEEALKRQEQVYQAKAELENKQLQKSYANEAKQLRIQLVKRAMRRVPFNRIDYTNARTIIAIQRMLEPNLLGGVNRFIGQDSPYLRGIVSGIITDADFRDKIIAYLKKTARGSEANKEFIDKIENLKTIEQFETWTKKERNYAIKKLPKENWIKELDLLKLAKEREEAIDLDIGMKEKQRASIDPKTGEARTDREGNLIMETTFELSYADEIGQMVKDAIGADMFNRLVNVPFAEWTTEDLEKLAGRINTLYKEGRDLLDAKKALKKLEADKIRMAIETAVKNTGIIINDDDTPEEKQRKQEKINKILGYSYEIKGTNENRIKKESWITRLLHGYSAANVRRVARILDGYKEGTNTQELYWKENEAYNFKTRSINNRVTAINEVLKANNITLNDLNKTVKDGRNEWTVDELLYIIAADKDFAAKEDKEGSELIDDNDDFAATSRNAVMFGNMLSATEFINLKEELKKQDDELKDRIDKGELTEEEAQNIILGTFVKNPGTQEFIAIAHARYENALAVARNFLAENPKYNALLEVISKDYTDQYDRMNQISIEEFNSPVHRVKAYVPLVRMESNGDTNANIVKEDLLATMGQSQNWVNKGMTARRVNISPLNQKPVEMGLYKTWTNSVERTEHFIAYAAYVRELNRVYKSRDAQFTRQHIENRYGKSMMKYIDNYINEVANPNANKIYDNTQQIVRTLRGKTAPAYLAWKASSIFKQAATSPWPYMQFVDPATYTAALFKCMKPGTYDAIRQKSVFMNNRRFDPLADLVDELGENSKNGWDKFIAKQSAIGMQGLEWIDWVAVAPGWLACYEKKYNELENAAQARYEAIKTQLTEENMYADISTGNFKTAEQIEAAARKETEIDTEKLAIDYADDCVRLCQPSNRSVDISPLFKSNNEFQKAVFQFQTSLNVIWQNIRYDIPYAVKQKQFKQMTGIILGYVFAGIAMNALMEGVGAGDDDEDKAIKDLIFYATTQFTDSIPLLGSAITNANQKIITGKGTFFTNGTDITPMVTKYLNVITKAAKAINESDDEKKKQAWMKAAESMAEGIGMYLGLPVQGIKEVEKLVGVGDGDGKMDISLDNIADVYGIVNNIKPKDK